MWNQLSPDSNWKWRIEENLHWPGKHSLSIVEKPKGRVKRGIRLGMDRQMADHLSVALANLEEVREAIGCPHFTISRHRLADWDS